MKMLEDRGRRPQTKEPEGEYAAPPQKDDEDIPFEP